MKLLIITQKVDKEDSILGFFHRWIIEFAKNFESLVVICLQKGKYDLPANVKVLSLGKEEGKSQLKYLIRFYRYIWQERKKYDAVFVHMNQEYVLLGWKFWKLLGKKIYMWRNHYAGNIFTDIASMFCVKVFCTSKDSYTAKYKKIVIMPVGIDTSIFKANENIKRVSKSILSLGRISPSKNIHKLLESIKILKDKGIDFTVSIYGDALPKDMSYYQSLIDYVQNNSLDDRVIFHKGIPNTRTPEVYSAHEIFVNLSKSGMYDKTIFEAIACGCLIIASNRDIKAHIDPKLIVDDMDTKVIAGKIQSVLPLQKDEKEGITNECLKFTIEHSLSTLAEKVTKEIS